MIKAILRLFKIHREMIFGNSPIIIQNMLRKTPKPLDAIDIIPGFRIDHVFRMINLAVLT